MKKKFQKKKAKIEQRFLDYSLKTALNIKL